MEEIKYPIRINKYLALKKICSRREADVFIKQKKVKINNRVAVLGDKVKENDNVSFDNLEKELIYLAFNKPKGIITHSPQGEEEEIKDIIRIPEKVFPLGRLDKDSHGLIILTNDGRITDKVLNPDYEHEKEYIVKTDKPITSQFLKRMIGGVKLDDGYITKECKVEKIVKNSFSIILTEGKKRQIRRMCAILSIGVLDLKRVRILNINIGDLKLGEARKIKGKELQEFLSTIKI